MLQAITPSPTRPRSPLQPPSANHQRILLILHSTQPRRQLQQNALGAHPHPPTPRPLASAAAISTPHILQNTQPACGRGGRGPPPPPPPPRPPAPAAAISTPHILQNTQPACGRGGRGYNRMPSVRPRTPPTPRPVMLALRRRHQHTAHPAKHTACVRLWRP